MERKSIIAIVFFSLIICFFNKFTLCADESKSISYLLKSESKSAVYELYFNGFLLSSKGKASSTYVDCLSKNGKNRIRMNVIGEMTDTPGVINVIIKEITMIGLKSTSSIVLSWEITLEQDKKVYEKEIELKWVGENLPWEEADKIETLSDEDIKKIKSMTLVYRNTLKKGNKEQIVKMLATHCQFMMKAEATFANKSEADMIKQFMFFYDMLFAPSVRGNVYEYREGTLDVSKSSYNDRVVIVKTKTQDPIIKIETQPDEEGKSSSSGLLVSKLHFIKMAGEWYIY